MVIEPGDSCSNEAARALPCERSTHQDMGHRIESIDEIDKELSRLKRRELDLKNLRNTLVPISSLPEEILSRIFVESQIHDKRDEHNKAWFAVSHVCRRWRSIALSCSALWSNIDFEQPSWAAELLSRTLSSSCSLSIAIRWLSNDDEELHIISDCITRVRELDTTWHILLHLLEAALKKTHTPLLQLERLSLHGAAKPISQVANVFVHGVPRLQKLKLASFHPGSVLLSPLPKTLTHLDLSKPDITVRSLLAGLLGLAQLERLAVCFRDDDSDVESPDGLSTVELKSLQHIRINGIYTSLLSMLLQHLFFPSYTTVSLHSRSITNARDLLHNLSEPRGIARPIVAPSSLNVVRSVEFSFAHQEFYMRYLKIDGMSLEDMSYDFWRDDQQPFELSVGSTHTRESLVELITLASRSRIPTVTSVLLSGITASSPPWTAIFIAFPNLQILRICHTRLDHLMDNLMPRAGDAKDGDVVPAPALKKLVLKDVEFTIGVATRMAFRSDAEKSEWLVNNPIKEFVNMLSARAKANAALDSLVLHGEIKGIAEHVRGVVPSVTLGEEQ